MEELDTEVYEKILKLSEEGNTLHEVANFNESIAKYKEAMGLLPNQKYEWDSFSWLANNIGLSYLELSEWDKAYQYFRASLLTPQGMEEALTWFCAGEALYKQELFFECKDYFIRAYLMNNEILDGTNKKYLDFIEKELHNLNSIN